MSEPDTSGPIAEDLRAKVFRDREHAGDWRVEKMDDDGGIEIALFSGGDDNGRSPMPIGYTASLMKSSCTRTTARPT